MTIRRFVTFLLFVAGCPMISITSSARRAVAQAAVVLSSQEHDVRETDLATYVDEARKQFNVPGIAIVVVKDGRVAFEQAFGERNVEDGKPVDAHTMFCIASNTKSFTATAVEMLADQGKLHLEDRVVDHLPWFRMAAPYVTREMRIRDLLAHRSGPGVPRR
jgi:CubicO group peptidase (beta-lactamase class C family)